VKFKIQSKQNQAPVRDEEPALLASPSEHGSSGTVLFSPDKLPIYPGFWQSSTTDPLG